MKHARADYDRIQDPDEKIPLDEPVFLVRGQDLSGPATLRYWALQNEKRHGDPRATALANAHARKMEEWQAKMKERFDRTKDPRDQPHAADLPICTRCGADLSKFDRSTACYVCLKPQVESAS